MKSMRSLTRRALPKRNALVVALALGMGVTGMAYGQATTGSIFGSAPVQAGETVTITSDTGMVRTATVAGNGSYSVGNLPVGNYTVTLMQNGEAVSSHQNVHVTVGGGTQINFGGGASGNAQSMQAVVVSASALPSIDVSSVSSNFTLSARQLQQLPVGQSSDAIALLAPGTTAGSNYFGGFSVGGAGVTENAYYVNGYNTTGLYNSEGPAYYLPYGAIAQQQTITGGFEAKYGRADGGIINQIGKRGTNEWHFGARVQWVPRSLRSSPKSTYYPYVNLTGNEEFTDGDKRGMLYRYRGDNKGWDENLSAYVGGALVKDKLFFFLAGETDRQRNRSVSSVDSQQDNYYKNHSTKWYGKLDWNINDSNVLEYTFLKDTERNGYGETFRYDPDNYNDLFSLGPNPWNDFDYKTQIFHYTGYLSDAATLSVLYGKTTVDNPQQLPFKSDNHFISAAGSQNPALNGGSPIVNDQTSAYWTSPTRGSRSNGLRVDFSYQLGDHLLSAGIDNMHYWSNGQGQEVSSPDHYLWIYSKAALSEDGSHYMPINDVLGVGGPPLSSDGYVVSKYIYSTIAKMSARQKAWYIQDDWQITPNLLISLGLRDDSFTNYNGKGEAFVNQTGQYEPRLGVSWDVFGDSSLKIYGNAGRYYLALPQGVANRQATASTYTNEYFTYTGIDANGNPTGLTPVNKVGSTAAPGADPAGPVSSNGEFGAPPDPRTVAALNLKPQYQDEVMVGFDKTLGDKWVYGAKATYRTLGTLIDDGCYPTAIKQGIENMGLNPDDYAWDADYCHLFNPNRTNVYAVAGKNGNDGISVPVGPELAKLPDAQRDYYALEMYLEHPFDGTWMGRIDYTFSRNWGNSEGQVRSDIGQGDIAATEDWDYAELMSASRGYLSNHVRHSLKAYGAWQMTPEWRLSGTLKVMSGHPVNCLGFFGPDHTNPGFGYGSDYHWCEGQPSPPGSTSTPWTKQLNLGIAYMPAFADHKLAFKVYVFNVLNEQKPIQVNPHRFDRYNRTVNNAYHMPIYYESPRYVRFTVSYDY